MPDSLKIAPLSDAAFRAYVTSICYAARSLSDGFIPLKKAKEFAGRARVIQELVPALWETAEGGFMVHDYLQYNPTRETVLAEREKAKERMNAIRSGNVRANSARTAGEVRLPPSPPVPQPDPLNAGGGGGRRNIFVLYEDCFGPIYQGVVEELKAMEDEYPPGCIEHCFARTKLVIPRPKSLGYVKAMLGTHQREGCDVRAPRQEPVPAGPPMKSYLYDD